VRRPTHLSLADGWPWSWPLNESGIRRDDILGLQFITSESTVLGLRVAEATAMWTVCQQSTSVKPPSFRANQFAFKREWIDL
jgi:hypothetical protein